MSQENVDLVRHAYETFNRGDLEGMRAFTAPEFEYVASPGRLRRGSLPTCSSTSPRYTRTGEYCEGPRQVREFRETGPWHGAPIHFKPERFFDVDDEHVLVFVHVSVIGTGSGIPVEMDAAHEFTIRDGLVVYFKVYGDRDEALEAAGLSE